MDALWVIWVDDGNGKPRRAEDYPVSKDVAEVTVAGWRRQNPEKRYAVIQVRQTPMPGDFR
jgi:hypothetical protein